LLALFWTTLGALSELDTLPALKFVADLQKNPKLTIPSVFDIANTPQDARFGTTTEAHYEIVG
jgi:hypothetical protein